MANGKIRFGKQSGGQLALVIPDGVDNTEVIVPESGELATKDYADLKQSKSELVYDVDTSSYIPNTLASGAIIERGSNANGSYIKYADGTLMCKQSVTINLSILSTTDATNQWGARTFPHQFISAPAGYLSYPVQDYTHTQIRILCYGAISCDVGTSYLYLPDSETFPNVDVSRVYYAISIGRWK